MTITSQIESTAAMTEIAELRAEIDRLGDRLGDRLAWAKLWDKGRQSSEMVDFIECLQQAMETIGYAISERDADVAEFEARQDGGAEMGAVHSAAMPYAA